MGWPDRRLWCCFLPGEQDSQDPNPLIRALAVRTMGCIRVDKITEYLCDPLHRCLKVRGAVVEISGTCGSIRQAGLDGGAASGGALQPAAG